MDKTANYNLPQWVGTDPIRMKPFNDAFDGIDLALKANADAAQALQSGKADAQTVSALAKNLGAAGHNCRIAFGEYTGTGTTGSDNPNALNFDFYPVLIAVAAAENFRSTDRVYFFLRPRTVVKSPYAGTAEPTDIRVQWADGGVSWYVTTGKATHQLNTGGTVYYYTVLGYDKNSELSE